MEPTFIDLPAELQNIILKYRATYLLKKICTRYYLDFDKLCDFLKSYKGIITGSCTLACFIPGTSFQDIDIFILRMPEKTTKPFQDFFPVFTVENTNEIKVDKCPVNDTYLQDPEIISSDYKYIYKYRNLIIDMNVYPQNTYNHMVQLRESQYDLDCCKIMFDGENWSLPYEDIFSFIHTRECKITLITPEFFSDTYEPFFLFDSRAAETAIQIKKKTLTDYILKAITTNYSDLKLATVLQKPLSSDLERIWVNILATFIDIKLITNYRTVFTVIDTTALTINSLIDHNIRDQLFQAVTSKEGDEGLVKSIKSIYAKIVLLKFLFRIIKYTLRGFHIVNLSLLAEGFPSSVVDKLADRECKCRHEEEQRLAKIREERDQADWEGGEDWAQIDWRDPGGW